MAQIDLGSIKFNWKGSYSGATAYVVDDVVESSGSSYICIAATTGNAPPNASYWEQMSAKGIDGIDGTDLTTTLTTQGDTVIRGASGLERLPIGTANQILQVNSGATALEYAAKPEGKAKQIVTGVNTSGATSSSVTTSSYSGGSIPNVGVAHVTVNITPVSSTSKLVIMANAPSGTGANGTGLCGVFVDNVCRGALATNGYSADASGATITCFAQNSSTSQRTVEFRAIGEWTGNVNTLGQIRNGHTTSFDGIYGSLIVMEVE